MRRIADQTRTDALDVVGTEDLVRFLAVARAAVAIADHYWFGCALP
jgi:hypothetical protein